MRMAFRVLGVDHRRLGVGLSSGAALAGLLGSVVVAQAAGGYVTGSTIGSGDTNASNFCVTNDDPGSSTAVWNCQTRTAGGGFAQINGFVGSAFDARSALFASNATSADSIAIGSTTTAATANSAIAIGAGSKASTIGGVALGAGSVASTAAGATGYVPTGSSADLSAAVGLTTSTLSALSIGDAANGKLRQITGVAAGTADTDAANIAQVKAVSGNVSALTDRAVVYDGSVGDPKNKITLAGSSGTTITNLKAGTVSGSSTDAVNGAQLYDTNQTVAALNTDALKWNSTLGAYDASHGSPAAQKISNLAAGTADTDAVNKGQLDAVSGNVSALTDRAVVYDGSVGDPKNKITLAGSSGTTITNLKAGTVSSSSTDAVNGAQLYNTNQTVAALNTDALKWNSTLGAYDASHGTKTPQKISNLAAGTAATDAVNKGQLDAVSGNVAALTDRAVVYDGSVGDPKNKITLAGSSGTTITNLKAGTVSSSSTDAINGAQLYDTNQTVAALNTDALKWNSTLGAYDASHGTKTPQKISNLAAGTAATDAVNKGQLDAVSGNVSNLSDRAVTYDGAVGAPKDLITLAGTSGTTITNLKAGTVSSSSTDAINGAQLFGVSTSVASALGGGAMVNPDGSIAAPNYTIDKVSYNNVGDALTAVDGNLTNINTTINNINNGGGITYFHANSSGPDSQASGSGSVAIGSAAVSSGTNSVTIGQGATASNAGDVALGAGSTTTAAVQTSTMTVNGTTYTVAGTATSTVSVGSVGAERTITNVAAGQVTASSTDAINGSQLYATNQALSSAVNSIGTLNKNAVIYDSDANGNKVNSITLKGGDPNTPVTISNVAAGVASNDAVNVAQLNSGMSSTLSSANSYTDNRTAYAIQTSNNYTDQKSAATLQQANDYTDAKFAGLSNSIYNVQSEARQAAAVGLAASSLRFDDRPGKFSASLGGATWGGEGAMALGVGYTTDDQILRANLTAANSGGSWGVGGGLSLTLN